MINIFKKKDPLLIAILYENIITLASTSIPLLTTILNIFFPTPIIPYLGSIFIASIQMYLAYFLFKKNIPKLIGEGIDIETLNEIVNLIKKNKYNI